MYSTRGRQFNHSSFSFPFLNKASGIISNPSIIVFSSTSIMRLIFPLRCTWRTYLKSCGLTLISATFVLILIDFDVYFGTILLAFNSRSEEHTSELQSRGHLVCRLLLEKKNQPPNALTHPD